MSFTLYFSPGACSFVPHVMLELAQTPFEAHLVKLHRGEHLSPEFKALNPEAQVPVLVHEERVLTQIVAITLYLNDLFPGAHLLPSDAFERAQVMQTLAWMNNTVHPTFTHVFRPAHFSDDPVVQADIKAHAIRKYQEHLITLDAFVAQQLGKGRLGLGGEHLGPLDAYALTLCRWGTLALLEPTQFPNLWAHVQHIAQHPDVARAIATERLVLNTLERVPSKPHP
jgi:glutathione S-transferase